MEVGIEDCCTLSSKQQVKVCNIMLYIGYIADQSYARYHLKDVIVARIYFLLVRIKIKHMNYLLYDAKQLAPHQPVQRERNNHEV